LISALLVMHRSQIRHRLIWLFVWPQSPAPTSVGLGSRSISSGPQSRSDGKQRFPHHHAIADTQIHHSSNLNPCSSQLFKIEHYPWILRPSRARTSTVRMYSFLFTISNNNTKA